MSEQAPNIDTSQFDRKPLETVREVRRELSESVVLDSDHKDMLVGAVFVDPEDSSSTALLESDPGLGKTTIAKSIAKIIGGNFGRVQGNPEMQPSDIQGVQIFNQQESTLEFVKGAIFSNVFFADEVNRISPRAQAAFLQAMAERKVTVGDETYEIDDPFFVIATQNPHENNQGTYPLNKAQKDRFAIRIGLQNPTAEQMIQIDELDHEIQPVIEAKEEIIAARSLITAVSFKDVNRYAATMVENLREHEKVNAHESNLATRAYKRIKAYSQFNAFLNERREVEPSDVRKVAPYVLEHRTAVTEDAEIDEITPEEIISEVIKSHPDPRKSQ